MRRLWRHVPAAILLAMMVLAGCLLLATASEVDDDVPDLLEELSFDDGAYDLDAALVELDVEARLAYEADRDQFFAMLQSEAEAENLPAKPATPTTKATSAPKGTPAPKGAPATNPLPGKFSKPSLAPAAVRLQPAEHLRKYKRFVGLHPKRVNRKDPATDLKQFSTNRAVVIALNDRHGTAKNPTPFKTTGPWANMSPAEFKKRYRNTKHPSKRKSKGNGVIKLPPSKKKTPLSKRARATNAANTAARPAAKATKTLKGGRALVELGQPGGAGGRAGGASGAAGRSGGKGTDAGGGAGRSGGKGTDSGRSGSVGTSSGVGGYGTGTAAVPLTGKQCETSMINAGVGSDEYLKALGKIEQWPTYSKQDVVEQGACGSCWAQTAANSLFQNHFKYYPFENNNDRPSVQQILDCVKTSDSSGCIGGTPMDAMAYLQTTIIIGQSSYPLRADESTGACRTGTELMAPNYKSFGWSNAVPACTSGSCAGQQAHEMKLLELVYDQNLIPIVYVDSSNWQVYAGGIFPTSLCSSSPDLGDHVVELVATYSEGVPYWIVRNSWGKDWGEQGHIFLPFGVNACGLANFAVVPSAAAGTAPRSALEMPIITDDGQRWRPNGENWDDPSKPINEAVKAKFGGPDLSHTRAAYD